jgi:hypothetical protein
MTPIFNQTYHAAQNEMIAEVLLTVRTVLRLSNLFLAFEPLISENKVELFDDIILTALVIE